MRLFSATMLFVVALAVSSCTDSAPSDPADSVPIATPSETAAAEPQTLDDLPVGPPPALPYLVGRRLIVDQRTVELDGRPVGMDQAGAAVAIRYHDGRVVYIDTSTLRTRTLATTSDGGPVISPGGDFVAWQTTHPGEAEVAIRYLRRPFDGDEQVFPATPSCCDHPFLVHGMSQLGHLFVSLPGSNRAWVWDVAEGQEGIPYLVPDSDDYVREIRGLGGRYITDVTSNEIVLTSGGAWVSVGTATDGSYKEAERIRSYAADFSDPRARRILFTSRNGDLHIRDRTSGPNPAKHPGKDVVIDLGPRTEIALDSILWEDLNHLLVEVSDHSASSTIRRALVRCNAKTGACELAVRLDREN